MREVSHLFLDELIHSIKDETTSMVAVVDIDEIIDHERFEKHLSAIEHYAAELRRRGK